MFKRALQTRCLNQSRNIVSQGLINKLRPNSLAFKRQRNEEKQTSTLWRHRIESNEKLFWRKERRRNAFSMLFMLPDIENFPMFYSFSSDTKTQKRKLVENEKSRAKEVAQCLLLFSHRTIAKSNISRAFRNKSLLNSFFLKAFIYENIDENQLTKVDEKKLSYLRGLEKLLLYQQRPMSKRRAA